MNLQQKKLIAFCSLAVVVGIPTALVLVLHKRISPDPPPLGSMLQRFSGRFANRTAVTSDDLIGRKLALIFFKFDCPHCQRELQNLETLSKSHDALDLQFLAIPLHDARTTEEYLQHRRLAIPTLVSSDMNFEQEFGVAMVPAIYLYDENGLLVGFRSGERSMMADQKLIQDFVGESFPSFK